MAMAISRTSISRLGINCMLGKTCQPMIMARVTPVMQTQVAHLRATYGEKYPYSKPFPYEKKRYNSFTEWIDGTGHRINENSKIITVEGNVAVGKNEFAKRLAAMFDMKYMPTVDDSYVFINPENGFDLRSLNQFLPKDAQYYDVEAWLSDPNPSPIIARVQCQWFVQKVMGYLQAMLHVLSTGQGVVVANSAFGMAGFMEAQKRFGFITKNFYRFFGEMRDEVLVETLRPHIVVYLDAPVNVIRERINKRNKPYEVNSKVLSDDFLTEIDKSFKDVCLPLMRKTSEVLQVDWTTPLDDLDMEALAEEMTRLKLESEDREDPKFADWYHLSEDQYALHRKKIQHPAYINSLFRHQFPTNCPELILPDTVDDNTIKNIIQMHPAVKYTAGWAPEFGHNTLFKF